MKITIAYLPGEERYADVIKRVICGVLGMVKIRRSDRRPPYRHIYIATEKQLDASCKNGENMV